MNETIKLINFLDNVMDKGSFLFSEEANTQAEETYAKAVNGLMYEELLKMPKVQNRKQDGITFYLLGEPGAHASLEQLEQFRNILESTFKLYPETRHPYIINNNTLSIFKNTSDDTAEVKRLMEREDELLDSIYGADQIISGLKQDVKEREEYIKELDELIKYYFDRRNNDLSEIGDLKQKILDLEEENATLRSNQVIYQFGTAAGTGSFINNVSTLAGGICSGTALW